eukprot:Hpha_TRINITY_DN16386_c0_g1::TRINITY_DN16386_c0_g1_i1::g.62627::m.62627/K08177/oxlT; MFS transporter, OFA family, oxalate/formate antiporter
MARPTLGPWQWRFVLPQSVLTAALIQGVPFVVSVLSEPLRDARPDWPKHTIPISLSTSSCIIAVTGWYWSFDLRSGKARGTRFWLMVGVLSYLVGFILASLAISGHVGSNGGMYMFIGGVGLACSASLGMIYAACVTHAVAHFGPGYGSSLFGGTVGLSATFWAPLLSHFVDAIGLSQSLLIVALCAVPVLFLATGVKLSRSLGGTGKAFAKEPTETVWTLLRNPQYFLALFVIVGGLLPGWGVISMYADILRDLGNTSHAKAAALVAVVNAAYCAGRVCGGPLLHHIGSPSKGFAAVLLTEGCAFGGLILLAGRTLAGCTALLCLAAMCFGTVKVGIPHLVVETFGARNFNVGFMMVGFGFSIASICGPIISAQLAYTTSVLDGSDTKVHGHDNFFAVAVIVCAFGVLATTALRRYVDQEGVETDFLDGECSDSQESDPGWVFVPSIRSVSNVGSSVHDIQ